MRTELSPSLQQKRTWIGHPVETLANSWDPIMGKVHRSLGRQMPSSAYFGAPIESRQFSFQRLQVLCGTAVTGAFGGRGAVTGETPGAAAESGNARLAGPVDRVKATCRGLPTTESSVGFWIHNGITNGRWVKTHVLSRIPM